MLLLLPVVTRKLKRSVSLLLPHPPVFAHTIYQAISFDGALREEGFDLSGTSAEVSQGKNEWKGVSDSVLGRSDWFNAWLQGEKKCTSFTYPGNLSLEGPDGCPLFVSHDIRYLLGHPVTSVALDQYHASLTSGDPWRMVDDQGDEFTQEQDLRPTNSARRVKALIEQVTGQKISFCARLFARILTRDGM